MLTKIKVVKSIITENALYELNQRMYNDLKTK